MHRTLSARLRDLREDDGFTLIELLVVVIIIGILAAIAIPVFLHQRQKAYDASAKSDIRNAALAEEAYFADHGQYAPLDVVNTEDPVKLSSGDTLISVFVSPTQGYCLGALDSKGSPLPATEGGLGALGVANIVWWYDSGAGGLQPMNAPLTANYGCPAINTTVGATTPSNLGVLTSST